jgi:hypothetical protein
VPHAGCQLPRPRLPRQASPSLGAPSSPAFSAPPHLHVAAEAVHLVARLVGDLGVEVPHGRLRREGVKGGKAGWAWAQAGRSRQEARRHTFQHRHQPPLSWPPHPRCCPALLPCTPAPPAGRGRRRGRPPGSRTRSRRPPRGQAAPRPPPRRPPPGAARAAPAAPPRPARRSARPPARRPRPGRCRSSPTPWRSCGGRGRGCWAAGLGRAAGAAGLLGLLGLAGLRAAR